MPLHPTKWTPGAITRRETVVLEFDSIIHSPDVALTVTKALQFDADMAVLEDYGDNQLL